MLLAIAAVAAAAAAQADDFLAPAIADIPQHYAAKIHDTGVLSGRTLVASGRAVVYANTLYFEGAAWTRLDFDEAATQLAEGEVLRVTSLLDGHVQHLTQDHLRRWSFTSAYFNGDAVKVEVLGTQETAAARVVVEGAWVGERANGTSIQSICGPNDERTLSEDPRAGRWMTSGGCTGWLIGSPRRGQSNCMLTAGHCGAGSPAGVLQFNVPLSSGTGGIVNPPPSEQFPGVAGTNLGTNGGVGNDWLIMELDINSETGLTAIEHAGGLSYRLAATAPPATSQELRITGYGVTEADLPREWSQVQKTHAGAYTSLSGTSLRHTVDTTGGNSGSAIEDETTGLAIGIHTHGGCSRTGSGSNAATAIGHPDLQAAIAEKAFVCGL